MTLRTALTHSANTPAVRLGLEVGMAEVVRTARAMGVQTPLRTDPTVALGSSEVTPMDQARGYATIARLGRSTEPVYLDALHDVRGATLGRSGDSFDLRGVAVRLPGGPGEQVLDPGVAYELADMLRSVVQRGTARRAHVADRFRAGKTGTTNDFVDAWFVGFTPEYTIAVWIGTDGTRSLGEGETGGRAALPAWVRIVEALGETSAPLRLPDEAVTIRYGDEWVGLARGHVPASVLPVHRPGTAPLPAFVPE